MRYSKVLHRSRELDERFLRRPRNKILLFWRSSHTIVSQKQNLCNHLHVTLFDVAPYIATDSLGIAKNMLNLAYCQIHFILHCTPDAQGHRV